MIGFYFAMCNGTDISSKKAKTLLVIEHHNFLNDLSIAFWNVSESMDYLFVCSMKTGTKEF